MVGVSESDRTNHYELKFIIMYKTIIGENAGKVWNFLYGSANYRSKFNEIKEGTGLSDLELAAAIGWLARENKIQIDCEHPEGQDKTLYFYLMLNVYF